MAPVEPHPGPDASSEEEADDDDEIDPDKLKADELAQQERKKAGIPELEHDALPSTIATKMLPFGCV